MIGIFINLFIIFLVRLCNNPPRCNKGQQCKGADMESKLCRGFDESFRVGHIFEVSGCEGSYPRWDVWQIQNIFEDPILPKDPLLESWVGQSATCDKIVIADFLVTLEDLDVTLAIARRCKNVLKDSTYRVGTLHIVANRVYVSQDVGIFGLQELRIDSRLLLVKSNATKLELKQGAASDGKNARVATFNGNNGSRGTAGTNGTRVYVRANKIIAEGPFVISVQGGDGGRGGNGSEGKRGETGLDASVPPRYESERWQQQFLTSSLHECTSCAFDALIDGIRYCPGRDPCWDSIPRNSGGKGNSGGRGGSGGAGGTGGNSGSISVSTDALDGDLLVRVIPGEGGRGGTGARGGQGGLGGLSSEGMEMRSEDEWCGGDDDNVNNHCYHRHLPKVRGESGSDGDAGASGKRGSTGVRL